MDCSSPKVSEMRTTRLQMYMEVCHALRKRSTCLRGKVGCIAVQGGYIVAEGYNGSPPGAPHCFDLGCDVPANVHESGCQRTIHAEANLIAHAARRGIGIEGATLYSTHGPCLKCAQLIVAAGFREVIFETPYRLSEGLELLRSLDVSAVML
jgi:dCMP deaminase